MVWIRVHPVPSRDATAAAMLRSTGLADSTMRASLAVRNLTQNVNRYRAPTSTSYSGLKSWKPGLSSVSLDRLSDTRNDEHEPPAPSLTVPYLAVRGSATSKYHGARPSSKSPFSRPTFSSSPGTQIGKVDGVKVDVVVVME